MRAPLAAVLLLAAVPATAQDVEITPLAGYRFGGGFDLAGEDGPLEVKESAAFGISVGIRLADDGELEVEYSRQPTRLANDGFFTSTPLFDLAVENWLFGGNYVFGEAPDRVRPFLGIGLGLTRLIPEPDALESETRFAFYLAGGVKVYLSPRFGLRFDARWLGTVLESDSQVFCNSFGGCLVFATGSTMSQGEVRGGLIVRF
jgi:hypothetical protein